MPNLPISQLPTASALTGPELFATVQGGVTKQTTFNAIYTGLTGSFYTTGSFGFYGAFCSTASQTNPTPQVYLVQCN
jgi:hypothetical protein